MVPQIGTPSLEDKSTRSSTWASDKSTGRVRQGRRGSQKSVRRYDSQKRLIKVLEPDQNGQPTVETDYEWSGTGKLIQITQHGQDGNTPRVRNFQYDKQDRLISESSPESGVIIYTYNNTSTASMKDARGITTSYIWDGNGNITGKQYSNGDPSAVYVYDGISGHLTSSYLQAPEGRIGERTYHYNEQGKPDRITQNINALHALSFNYDVSGHLADITYPDGRVVHQTWDSGGHVSSIKDQNGAAYLSGLQYDANGALSMGYFGDNLTAYFSYTGQGNLEQLQIDRDGKTILDKNYSYTGDGSLSSVSDVLHPESGFSYRYDDLQRVAGYTRLNGEHEHSYSYDAFGNLRIDISSPFAYNANNRINAISGIAYDASGNMTNDGRHSYQYDAEGRISQVDGGSVAYLYSAEGDRIQKRVGKDITETIWVGNDLLAELSPDGTWVDYLYVDGMRIAAIRKSDVTYYVSDPLGITRMELSSSGEILAQSYMTPFGQLINNSSNAEEVPFTGGEQYDVETGLYSYKYRSYNPLLGRWMSPDPSNEEYASLRNPQSLNLYSYVINDPLKYVDLLGLSASGGSCPATQKCAVGNCTYQIYYGTTPFGNLCASGTKEDGSPATVYSMWDCTSNISDCENSANTQPFLNACSDQGQTPMDCNYVPSVPFGQAYYCLCCDYNE
jgi:RHS repeat-associated protein